MADRLVISTVVCDKFVPAGSRRNQVLEDVNVIRAAKQLSVQGERLVLADVTPNPDVDELQTALHNQNPHVAHFACHGSPAGLLLRARDNDVESEVLSKDDLRLVLEGVPNLRLVVLSCCDTSDVGAALHDVADAVVVMTKDVSDGAAQAFTRRFYQELSLSGRVDKALKEGRNAIHHLGLRNEVETPDVRWGAGVDTTASLFDTAAPVGQNDHEETFPLVITPPKNMHPSRDDRFRFAVLEVCKDRRLPPKPRDLINHTVYFTPRGEDLVADLRNPKAGLQYKCWVELSEGRFPSDARLARAFEKVGWHGISMEGPQRRWFLTSNDNPTDGTLVNDYRMYKSN